MVGLSLKKSEQHRAAATNELIAQGREQHRFSSTFLMLLFERDMRDLSFLEFG